MHFPVAIRAKRYCVFHRIRPAIGQPLNMVCFQIRATILSLKRGWLST